MDKSKIYDAAITKAAALLLAGTPEACDVPRALALLELAREGRAIIESDAYAAGAKAMRSAAAEVVHAAYQDYASKPDLAWSDMKFLAEQIADMQLPFEYRFAFRKVAAQ